MIYIEIQTEPSDLYPKHRTILTQVRNKKQEVS